ncbi:MAG: aryl-sulfate sulfotransferase [Haloarculaceae archaeon]
MVGTMVPSKRSLRVLFAVVFLCSVGAVASSFATAQPNIAQTEDSVAADPGPVPTADPDAGSQSDPGQTDGTATLARPEPSLQTRANRTRLDPADSVGNVTVVATQGFYVSDEQAELVAVSEDGEVLYYDDTYRVYFDVDPVPGERYTVEYVASRHLDGGDCAAVRTDRCTYNVVRELNLTTGADREVYGEVTPQVVSGRWHDVDRVNDTHLAIADIVRDSVRIVDTRTGETTWEWSADATFDRSEGGQRGDWTHLNDVEVLPDGRVMASVRNMDQVVFVEPGEGVQKSWTLGAENDYETLYEQHNPDYIPASRGGPAVLVADSENGRVLEYRRVDPETGEPTTAPDGVWRRNWGWRDARVQWPRDADRLPDGTTLVTDTHGDRVAQVAPNGSVVWSFTVGMPYEAERLGTGGESAGGESIPAVREAGTEARDSPLSPVAPVTGGDATRVVLPPEEGPVDFVWVVIKRLVPSLPVNGVLFAGPSWLRFHDVVFASVALAAALAWVGLELRWAGVDPRRVRRGRR